MKITKKEILRVYRILDKVTNNYNKNLTYCISIYKKRMCDIYESIILAMSPSDSYIEYDSKRSDILNKYAMRDVDNQIIIQNDKVLIDKEFVVICLNELKTLDSAYESVLIIRKNDIKNFENMLLDEVDVCVEKIDWKYIPDEIDQTLMDALLPIINREGSE